MKPRRSQGQGSLSERPPGSGRWRGRVFVGRDEAGKPVYASMTFAASCRSNADDMFGEWCRATRIQYGSGTRSGEVIPTTHATFEALLRAYVEDMADQWSPSGRQTHMGYVEGYLLPYHRLAPDRVTPKLLGSFYTGLLDEGGQTRSGRHTRGHGPAGRNGVLGKNTVGRIDTMIKAAFNYAIAQGTFKGANPTAHPDAKRWRTRVETITAAALVEELEKPDCRIPERWEIGRLIEATRSEAPDFTALGVLADGNGPRRGEALALTLADWDASHRRLAISKRVVGGDGGEVIVRGTKDGRRRGFPPREVPVTLEVAAALNRQIDQAQFRAVAASDPAEFGAAIRERRSAASMTQEELAHTVGLSVSAVSLLERGRSYGGRHTVAPRGAVLVALGAVLGLHWSELRSEGALRPNAFLFSPKADGSKHWSLETGSRTFLDLTTRLGLEPFGLQGIRRRVSTDLVATGTPPKDLMALMGHSYAVAIKYYTESTAVSREAAITRLGSLSRAEPSEITNITQRVPRRA